MWKSLNIKCNVTHKTKHLQTIYKDFIHKKSRLLKTFFYIKYKGFAFINTVYVPQDRNLSLKFNNTNNKVILSFGDTQ
jgi:hypothetical protein